MTARRPSHPLVTAAALAAALLAAAAPAQAAGRLFTLDDPRGDDHGNGHLVYPLEANLEPGELDLLEFSATRERGGTRFEVTFAKPIRRPGPGAIDELGTALDDVARHGFYTFNVDVYVDVDRQAGSGATTFLPGRRAVAAPGFAWDRAVVLTPRPHVARATVKELMMESLREELKSDEPVVTDREVEEMRGMIPGEVERRIHFPNRVRVRGQKVSFHVPDEFFGAPPEATWAYTVIVTGADLAVSFDLGAGYGLSEEVSDRMMVLPLAYGTWTDRFGGGREDDDLQPPIVDLIAPEGMEQELLLNDYDPVGGRPVALPGVVPAEG